LAELSLIKEIKNEPLLQLVICLLVAYKIIDLIIKYFPQWFSKDKKMPFGKWQKFVSEKLGAIESTLATHEFLLDKTSEGTLENMLFNDALSPFIRLKAFRRLLAKGKNGRIWDKGYLLILDNKRTIKTDNGKEIEIDVWRDVLDTELGIPIVDKEYYEARLKEIRRRIYDDYSEK
jgi:2-C-methyl-D-erythritol 4-phosphate cytidylyltransferase